MFRGQRLSREELEERARKVREQREQQESAGGDVPVQTDPAEGESPSPEPSSPSADVAAQAAPPSKPAADVPPVSPNAATAPPPAEAPASEAPSSDAAKPTGGGGWKPLPGQQPGGQKRVNRAPRQPDQPATTPAIKGLNDQEVKKLADDAKHANVDADLEAEMAGIDFDAAMGTQELGDVSLADRAASVTPDDVDAEIELREGTVTHVSDQGIFINFGGKIQGLATPDQWEGEWPKEGDTVEVEIKGYDNTNDLLQLSTKGAAERATWATLHKDMIVEAHVTGTNKGGLECEFNGIKAFMPLGQVQLERFDSPTEFVGKTLRSKVTEVNKRARRVVISAKLVEIEQRTKQKEELLANLREGDVVKGRVRQVTTFGAFLDLGGADGLLHISDLSYGRVQYVTEYVKGGDVVDVVVLKIDHDKKDKKGDPRISLGLKQLKPDPWTTVEDKYHEGQDVTGRITRTAPFGAFCEVEAGVEGLIPVSEMSYFQRIRHPDDVVKVGQNVQAKVIRVEAGEKKLTLSLKQIGEDPWTSADTKYAPGTETFGKITRLASFGAFCELEPGVEGLIPMSELSYDRRVRSAGDVVKEGDEVRVKVLNVDPEAKRVGLSVKQLSDDPWAAAKVRYARDTKHKGRVTRIAEFGAFVELAPTVEGLIHISELSEDHVKKVSDVVQEGQEVEVRIIEVDPHKQRLSLSLREAPAEYTPEDEEPVERAPLIPEEIAQTMSGSTNTAEADQHRQDAQTDKAKGKGGKKKRRGGLTSDQPDLMSIFNFDDK